METRTDIELISAFTTSGADSQERVQGEAAFAELISRHQHMVFRTCLRMLNDAHEAQDATQATFIVLMKKADRLKREGALGGWLHAVARRVSLEAIQRRASEAKRREAAAAVAESNDGDATVDSEAVLRCVDEELEGLSAIQRQALVLRYLEGHGEREAAQLAGCPVGTLTRRASDGIARLRNRLAKRGIAIGLPALAAALASEAQAAIPETLLSSTLTTVKAYAAGAAPTGVSTSAAVLAKGAMNMMFWSSVKTAAIAVAVTGAVVGTGTVVAQKAMEASPSVGVASKPKTEDLRSLVRLRRENDLLTCEWICPTNPAGMGRFETLNPRLSCVAYPLQTQTFGPGAVEIYGTNMAERAGTGIWHFKMRANAANSNFWVMVMYGTKAPIACIEYIQSTNQLRLIRTVWAADGRLDPDKRLDVRTGPNIEELKTKAGEELRKHLVPVLAMITTQDLIGPADNVMRFFEADNGKTVTIPVGLLFEVHLTNDREGAGWEPGATEITGKSVAHVDNLRRMNCDEFVPADPSTNSTKGTYVYRYKAATTGESRLRLVHEYPSGPRPVVRKRSALLGEFKLTVEVSEGGSAQGHAVTPARLKDWLTFVRTGELQKNEQVTISEDIPAPKPGEWAIRKGQIAGLRIEFNGDKTSESRRVIVRSIPNEMADTIVASVREMMGKETDKKGQYHSWREVTGGPKTTDQKLLHVTLNEDTRNPGTMVFMVFFGPNLVQ